MSRGRARRRFPILLLLGALLLAGALGLTGYNVWESDEAGRESQAALDGLLAALAGQDAPTSGNSRTYPADGAGGYAGVNPSGEAAGDPPDAPGPDEATWPEGPVYGNGPLQASGRIQGQTVISSGEIEYPNYVLNPNMDMPQKNMYGYGYIATLSLPRLKLELPIMDKWDYHRLRIAPCRYFGSAYTANLVIAAHNYRSHFGRLTSMRLGDEVTLTDMDGNVFRYEVAEVTTLSPNAVETMTSGEWPLTLFTCTVGGQQRVTVRCDWSDG